MQAFTIFAAKYLFALGPFFVAFVWLRANKANRRSLLLRTIASAILGAALAHILGSEYYDQRPFVRLHAAPLIPHVADNGFPSDHTLVIAACSFLLIPFAAPLAGLLGAATILVAWSRVAANLHSPLDVVAGILIAAFSVFIARVLVRRKPKTGREFTDNDPKTPTSTTSPKSHEPKQLAGIRQ